MKTNDTDGGYFSQIIADAVRELNKHGSTYCFSLEQCNSIIKKVPGTTIYKNEDGIYYLYNKELNERDIKSNKSNRRKDN